MNRNRTIDSVVIETFSTSRTYNHRLSAITSLIFQSILHSLTSIYTDILLKHIPKHLPKYFPTEVTQIETHTQREELGNTASSQLPPASTPACPFRVRPRGRPHGRAGTGHGDETHVNNNGVSKPSQCGRRGRGSPAERAVLGVGFILACFQTSFFSYECTS